MPNFFHKVQKLTIISILQVVLILTFSKYGFEIYFSSIIMYFWIFGLLSSDIIKNFQANKISTISRIIITSIILIFWSLIGFSVVLASYIIARDNWISGSDFNWWLFCASMALYFFINHKQEIVVKDFGNNLIAIAACLGSASVIFAAFSNIASSANHYKFSLAIVAVQTLYYTNILVLKFNYLQKATEFSMSLGLRRNSSQIVIFIILLPYLIPSALFLISATYDI